MTLFGRTTEILSDNHDDFSNNQLDNVLMNLRIKLDEVTVKMYSYRAQFTSFSFQSFTKSHIVSFIEQVYGWTISRNMLLINDTLFES